MYRRLAEAGGGAIITQLYPEVAALAARKGGGSIALVYWESTSLTGCPAWQCVDVECVSVMLNGRDRAGFC